MKEKRRLEYNRRTRKLHGIKLCCKNLIKRMNSLAVLLLSFLGPFFKRTRQKRRQMDTTTRKLVTMLKALQPRDYLDKFYVSRNGERKRAVVEDSLFVCLVDFWHINLCRLFNAKSIFM